VKGRLQLCTSRKRGHSLNEEVNGLMMAMSQRFCRTPSLYLSLSHNVLGINSAEIQIQNTKAAGTNTSRPSGTQLIKSSWDLLVLENMVQVKCNVCHPLKPVYSSLTGHVTFGIIYAWTTTPKHTSQNGISIGHFSCCNNYSENLYHPEMTTATWFYFPVAIKSTIKWWVNYKCARPALFQ